MTLSTHLEGFAWQGSTLLVQNDDKIKKIRRKNLSASVASNIANCPAGMAASSVLPWLSDPFAPNELGTAAHSVLEAMYKLPAAERTKEFIIAEGKRHGDAEWDPAKLDNPDLLALQANIAFRADWTKRVTAMALGDFALEDPTTVDVFQAELDIRDIVIGPTKVPFRGFIDRLDRVGADERGDKFEVNDYKGLALTTPLPTPTGWTTMGEVQEGEWVLGTTGPVQVTVKSGVHHRPCFRVAISDGSSVIADNVHLWEVEISGADGFRTVDTDELLRLLNQGRTLTLPTPILIAGHHVEDPAYLAACVRTRWVSSVVPTQSVPTQCIQVLAADSLYLAGTGFVVTHNTGKYKAPNPRFGDSYGDQMRLYSAAVEVVLGRMPEGANLLYTAAGKKREIDLSAGAMKQTLYGFDQAWQQMNSNSDAKSFPAKPGGLCGWCDIVNSCPVAQLKSEKAIAHAATMPSREDLGIPVIPVPAPVAPQRRRAPQPVNTPGIIVVHESGHLPVAPRIDMAVATPYIEQEQNMTTTTQAALQYPTSEYAAMAAFSLTDTAVTHLDENGQPLSPSSMAAFTSVLAGIVTRTETRLFGSFGWEHGKHARLGFALASTIKLRPAPFGKDAAAWQQWTQTMESILDVKATISLGLLTTTSFAPDAYNAFLPAAAVTA